MEQSIVNLILNVGAPLFMLGAVLYGLYMLGFKLIDKISPNIESFLKNYTTILTDLSNTMKKFDETLDRNNLILMKVCEKFDIEEESRNLIGSGGKK